MLRRASRRQPDVNFAATGWLGEDDQREEAPVERGVNFEVRLSQPPPVRRSVLEGLRKAWGHTSALSLVVFLNFSIFF